MSLSDDVLMNLKPEVRAIFINTFFLESQQCLVYVHCTFGREEFVEFVIHVSFCHRIGRRGNLS